MAERYSRLTGALAALCVILILSHVMSPSFLGGSSSSSAEAPGVRASAAGVSAGHAVASGSTDKLLSEVAAQQADILQRLTALQAAGGSSAASTSHTEAIKAVLGKVGQLEKAVGDLRTETAAAAAAAGKAAAAPHPSPSACPPIPSPAAAAAGGGKAVSVPANKRFETLEEAVQAQKDPRGNMVLFCMSNSGFHPITRNWLEWVTKVTQPVIPHFFVAPLDEEESRTLEREGAPQWFDSSRTYATEDSGFRSASYNDIVERKWELSLHIVELGVGAVMVDPDITLLRNPLPYLETAPECDMHMSIELNGNNATAEGVQDAGGYRDWANGMMYDNCYNTGMAYWRPTDRTRAFLREALAAMRSPEMRGRGWDDQARFNTWLQQNFHLKGVPEGADQPTKGRVTYQAIVQGKCLSYVRNGDASETEVLSFLPLNPALFQTRHAWDLYFLQARVMEYPFAFHHNYISGVEGKSLSMKDKHMWLLPGGPKHPSDNDPHWLDTLPRKP